MSAHNQQYLEEYFTYKVDELTEKAREKISQKVDYERRVIMGYLRSKLPKNAFARSVGMSDITFRRLCKKYNEITSRQLSEAQLNRIEIAHIKRTGHRYAETI